MCVCDCWEYADWTGGRAQEIGSPVYSCDISVRLYVLFVYVCVCDCWEYVCVCDCWEYVCVCDCWEYADWTGGRAQEIGSPVYL